jgi:hypothetical protein
MSLESLGLWNQATRFHIKNWSKLLLVFPLLVIPVLTEALHSLLIKQEIESSEVSPSQAVKQVWRVIPSLLGIKLYFECTAFLWGVVPIYGIIQGVKHRKYWAMGSNVLICENLSGDTARERCRELVEGFSGGIGVRTLITIPALLVTVFLILWAVNAGFVETNTAYAVWALVLLVFWILIPASAAVNTFFYIKVKESEE